MVTSKDLSLRFNTDSVNQSTAGVLEIACLTWSEINQFGNLPVILFVYSVRLLGS